MTDVVSERSDASPAAEASPTRRARRDRGHEPAHAGAPSDGPTVTGPATDETLLTADDVRDARFHATRDVPGYDQREVDAFLELVELTLRRLQAEREAWASGADRVPRPVTAPGPELLAAPGLLGTPEALSDPEQAEPTQAEPEQATDEHGDPEAVLLAQTEPEPVAAETAPADAAAVDAPEADLAGEPEPEAAEPEAHAGTTDDALAWLPPAVEPVDAQPEQVDDAPDPVPDAVPDPVPAVVEVTPAPAGLAAPSDDDTTVLPAPIPALVEDEPEPAAAAPADEAAEEELLTGPVVRNARFPILTDALGYVVRDVDDFLDRVAEALDQADLGIPPELDRHAVETVRFPTTWRGGYDQDAVDDLLDHAARSLPERR